MNFKFKELNKRNEGIKTVVLAILSVLLLNILQRDKVIAANNIEQDLITKICLSNFNMALKEEGIKSIKGMGEFTCRCFLEQINTGYSIDSSQELCKEKAMIKYKF